MKRKKTAKFVRYAILGGILAWVTYETIMHQVLGGGKSPSVHALCPYGALESLYSLLASGTTIQKIFSGTIVLFALTFVLALAFRRSFCGLLCPFGALQELFGMLRRKILKKRFTMPARIDRPLRYLKYAVLILTVVMAWRVGSLWMAPYDPYSAYAHITAVASSIAEDPLSITGFVLLGVTLAGSFLYDRFFCKYLCPVGALYGIIGKLSPTRVVRDDSLCTHCRVCEKACPMNLKIESAPQITSAECINCSQCVLACPKKGALQAKTVKKAWNPLVLIVLVTALFFGTLGIAALTGNYDVLPEQVQAGETVSISELKGYYTIEDAAAAAGLPLQELYAELGIPESVPKGTKLKDISALVPGFSLEEAKSAAGAP